MTSPFRIKGGRQRLSKGRSLITFARHLHGSGANEQAERVGRGALAILASALNWLEDSGDFERAHQELDRAGKFVRKAFGCHLEQVDGKYEQRCPVEIAHVRLGFSVEMKIQGSECSICKADYGDCPHIAGERYGGQTCVRIIERIEALSAVAIVARPAQPDARLTALPVDSDELRAALGPGFQIGMPVSCDRCLTSCGGFRELPKPL